MKRVIYTLAAGAAALSLSACVVSTTSTQPKNAPAVVAPAQPVQDATVSNERAAAKAAAIEKEKAAAMKASKADMGYYGSCAGEAGYSTAALDD
ncbi:MAG: hypothetical protein RMM31_06895 [Anaerolineae bacterium]|nr:hypothetical protein [Thermoflexales bacterium]MDW8395951.1 hypothetical protein [Anaerolineae bacterium]